MIGYSLHAVINRSEGRSCGSDKGWLFKSIPTFHHGIISSSRFDWLINCYRWLTLTWDRTVSTSCFQSSDSLPLVRLVIDFLSAAFAPSYGQHIWWDFMWEQYILLMNLVVVVRYPVEFGLLVKPILHETVVDIVASESVLVFVGMMGVESLWGFSMAIHRYLCIHIRLEAITLRYMLRVNWVGKAPTINTLKSNRPNICNTTCNRFIERKFPENWNGSV